MDIKYTRHAEEQMAKRQVTYQEVMTTLADPDVQYTDPDGKPIYTKFLNGRRVKVVTAADAPPHLVITVGN